MIKITISEKNSKLGTLPSFSTYPGKQFGCVSSDTSKCDPDKSIRDSDGIKCYVANYLPVRKNVRDSYLKNLSACDDLQAVKRQIVGYLLANNPRKFRWHVSGDILSIDYLNMMISIAELFPDIKFLAYTKALRILKLGGLDLAYKIAKLGNFALYISTMGQDQYDYVSNHEIFKLYPIAHCGDKPDKKFISCPEQHTDSGIKCAQCKVCWFGLPVLFSPH